MAKDRINITLKQGLADKAKLKMSGRENLSGLIETLLEQFIAGQDHTITTCLWPLYLASDIPTRKNLFKVFPELIVELRTAHSNLQWKKWQAPIGLQTVVTPKELYNTFLSRGKLYSFSKTEESYKCSFVDLKTAHYFISVCLDNQLECTFARLKLENYEPETEEEKVYLYQLNEILVEGDYGFEIATTDSIG